MDNSVDSIVEILTVVDDVAGNKSVLLYELDQPEASDIRNVHNIPISGCIVGKSNPVESILVRANGTTLKEIPVEIPSPDIQRSFSDLAWSGQSRFRAQIGIVGFPQEFELRLLARFTNGTQSSLSRIRGRHAPVRANFVPAINPLLIKGFGRSGTRVTLMALGSHPKVVRHRKYRHESRPALYWLHMLKVLSDPANHKQSSRPNAFFRDRSSIGHHPNYVVPVQPNLAADRWFGREYPEQLAEFCLRSIENFYRQVAHDNEQPAPTYFCEKMMPNYSTQLFSELYPKLREVLLVRDFRDTLTSMLAYSRKRGIDAFGIQAFESEQAYIRQVRASLRLLLDKWQTPSPGTYRLRYEDLVTNPEDSMRSLFDFLELEYSQSVLDEALKVLRTPIQEHVTSDAVSSSIGRWKKDLSPVLQAECQNVLGDVLNAFGYE